MEEYTGGGAHKSERFFQEDLRNENELLATGLLSSYVMNKTNIQT